MASKKYTLLSLALLCLGLSVFGQLGGVHNYLDSSYISNRNLPQQNEFINNNEKMNFPAKPRDQWQVGVNVGLLVLDGDCPPVPGVAFGAHIRKSLGYVLSLRASLMYGRTWGLDYRGNSTVGQIPTAVRNAYFAQGTSGFMGYTNDAIWGQRGSYIHNYQYTTIQPALDLLVSVNNIMFHSKQNRLNIYGLVGYSPVFYKTALDLLDASGRPYNFQAFRNRSGTGGGILNSPRGEIRDALKTVLDGTYETDAIVNDRRQNLNQGGSGNWNFRHSINMGIGAEYRISNRISVNAEYRFTMTDDDYLDGWFQTYPYYPISPYSPDKDNIIYTNLGLNINLGNMSKRSAPLWWLNPLDFVYSELNNPKHVKFKAAELPDGDADGVTDQFDNEPNTPAGCPVDSHGVSQDTDGDGVPDCKDKELITPTTCQPVDADGVGKCPDPPCCDEPGRGKGNVSNCAIGQLPSVNFKGNGVALGDDAKAVLATVASKMKAAGNEQCKISVVGYCSSSKSEQQRSWDRVNSVINYLVEKEGISADRFVFKYGETGGDCNTVDLQDATGSDGPNMVPAPHPQYKRSK
jgi:OmpA-OmpF porin, OOP family